MDRLAGKVALITGAAAGQGRAAALLFAKEGAKIVGCDLAADGMAETTALVREAGGEMTGMAPVDLSVEAEAKAWVEEAARAYGGIDILYNNAGVARMGTVQSLTSDQWRFTLGNELDLVYYTTHAAWPHLVARGAGPSSTPRPSSAGARRTRRSPRAGPPRTRSSA